MFVIKPSGYLPKLVLFFIAIFVFEETFYGRLDLSSNAYLAAKTSTEVLLYLLLIVTVLARSVQRHIQGTRISTFDVCLLFFIVAVLATTHLNGGSFFSGALNLRTMLRYVSIYYIIILSGWVPKETHLYSFFRFVVGIAVIQSVLIVIQSFFGEDFIRTYFSPVKAETNLFGVNKVLGDVSLKIGAGYGTLGKTAPAAFFLLFASIISLSLAILGRGRKKVKWWIFYIIIFIGMFLTYKKSVIILSMLSPLVISSITGSRRLVKQWFVFSGFLVSLLFLALIIYKPDGKIIEKKQSVSVVTSMATLITPEYWETSMSRSRGWMIMEVGRQAFVSLRPTGYGADEESSKLELSKLGGEFSKLVAWGAFDDVYIVAALIYYGPIGVGLLIYAYYLTYRRGKVIAQSRSIYMHRVGGVALATMCILLFLSVFVSRVPEFRAFAFGFWALAGMMLSILKSDHKKFDLRKPTALREAV